MLRGAISPVLNVANLRDLNSYEATGIHRRGAPLEELVLAHVAVVAELRKLSAEEETVVRMLVEGYRQYEIAAELQCSNHTVSHYVKQLRWSLYGLDIADAIAKARAAP